MTLKQAMRARKALGKVGAVVFIFFFASLLDSCVARFREPLFTVHLLPGASELVEGQVDHDMKDLTLLRVETSSETVQLKIDRFQTSYWLGGNMWIGSISAAVEAAAGTYDLRVFAVNKPPDTPVAAFRAHVYPDYPTLRKSFLSVIQRTFDIPPGRVALACIPLLVALLGALYLLSQKVERLLASQGRAEVFMLKAAPGGVEVFFGLGRRRGVEPGMTVQICAENGQPICDAVVQQAYEENAMALAAEGPEKLPHGAQVVLLA